MRSPLPTRFVSADRLFDCLDGRDLAASGNHWRIEVYSVRDTAGNRWVQLALDGRRHHVLTLRLEAGDGPESAFQALARWLANPSMTGVVFSVGLSAAGAAFGSS